MEEAKKDIEFDREGGSNLPTQQEGHDGNLAATGQTTQPRKMPWYHRYFVSPIAGVFVIVVMFLLCTTLFLTWDVDPDDGGGDETDIILKCFVDGTELKSTLESYFEGDDDTVSMIKKEYGWPMNDWCVSYVEDFSYLFSHERTNGLYESFNEDLSNWNTFSAINMSHMFHGLKIFNSELTNWDVSKVTDLQGMFSGAEQFNQDISNWDVSNVIFAESMFRNATSFNQDLSKWNVTNIRNFYAMFMGASSFQRDLCDWEDKFSEEVRNFTDMFAFSGCNMKDDPDLDAYFPGPFCDNCGKHWSFPIGSSGTGGN